MEDNGWGEGQDSLLGQVVEVCTPPSSTRPFRGAELRPSSSPHSLEAEAPGSVHGGSARGQKLGWESSQAAWKRLAIEARPAPSVLSTLAEANLNHAQLAKKKKKKGETMEFSCHIYQGVRKFFFRSDHMVMPASFFQQRSSSCFGSRLSGLYAYSLSWTLAQKPSRLWAVGIGPGLLLTLPHSSCWNLGSQPRGASFF